MGSNGDLRFLDAHHVETPAGPLNGFSLVSPSDARLGKVDGVLIDPAQRQVRYYVVKPSGWLLSHRYLLPATPARLEAEGRTLHIDVEPAELSTCPEADVDSFSRFSAEDALEAMFAKRTVA
jgi:PRC-barrel domain